MEDRQFGAIFSKKDIRDYRLDITKTLEFPKEFEIGLCDVKDQGPVGSCVAFSLSEIIEYHNSMQGNTNTMSTGYIYGNRRRTLHTDSGLVVRDALKTTCEYGDAAYSDFPYNEEVPGIIKKFEAKCDALFDDASKAHFEKYYRCYTEDEIKMALINDGPLAFAIQWYKDYKVNGDGILESTLEEKNKSGCHCMVIYGWNQYGWKIRNSWGSSWGKKGNAILPYETPIKEAWGIADDKSNTPLKRPYNTPFGKFLSKIFNFFINLFDKIFNK